MNIMKLTTFFAVMSMAAGVAIAQPADTAGTMMAGQEQGRPGPRGQMNAPEPGPFAKLHVAKGLPTLTPEQTQALDAFMEQRKAQAETMRLEMRTAMQQARDATDRQARQAIMQPLRQKMETAQQEIDAFLTATLTPEQLTEVNQKASDIMKKAGRDRMAGNDRMATGAKEGKAGKKGGKGKDGKRPKPDADPMSSDAASTGTAAANPFAEE